MTGKPPRQLAASLREVFGISSTLLKDVNISLETLLPLVTSFEAENGYPKKVAFWTRTTIRCFMGLLDGLSFSMRKAVLQCAQDTGLTLAPKEQESLKNDYLATLPSFKLAFRLFPRLFASDYTLNTGGEEWRGLKRIAAVRNSFTHPKVFEDLAVHPAIPALIPTIIWVHSEARALFHDIGHRLNVNMTLPPTELDFPKYREAQAPWLRVFKEEDYSLIKSYGGRTLEYVKEMFFMLSDDTKQAMGLASDALSSRTILLSPLAQFAFRTYARTLFSEIEGATSAARFFIEAAVDREKVWLSDADRASLEEGEIEDRFVAACNLWAREFGNDYFLEKKGTGWKHLRGARAFRNRITHPKSPESLKVDLELTKTLLDAHSFFMEGWGEGLYLDAVKWVEKAGGIDEAIEKEQEHSKQGYDTDDI